MQRLIIFLLMALLCQSAFGQNFHLARTGIHLSLPGAGWGLDFPAKDFLVEDAKIAPDGNSISCRGGGNDIIMLCYFEKAPVEGGATACRDYYMEKSKEAPMTTADMRAYEMGELAVFEYLVTEFQGKPVNQMNVHAYIARNGFCAEVHLSRNDYEPGARKDLDKVLDEIMASNGVDLTISQQFDFAMLYYTQEKYDSAIIEYEKVLEREKELTKFNKYFPYIAYDNLAASYLLSGNSDKAIEVCERGLRQDKKYPMYYYTTARIYAEKGEANLALDNLKKAYKNKDHIVMMGHALPDPRTDDSFRELLKQSDFRTEVEKLMR